MALATHGRTPSCLTLVSALLRTLPTPPSCLSLKLLRPESEVPSGLACWKSGFEAPGQPQKGCHSPAFPEKIGRLLATQEVSKPCCHTIVSIPGPLHSPQKPQNRGIRRPRFESQLCLFLPGWPQGNWSPRASASRKWGHK